MVIQVEIKGIIVPMITPFDENRQIDFEGLEWLINYLVNNKVNGLFPNSTTGEFVSLSTSEMEELVKKTIEIAPNKVIVLPGITTNSTSLSLELGKKFADYGADGFIIMPPYFYKVKEEELYGHFSTIAEKLDKPIIIYNNPYTTGVVIPIKLYERLVREHSNIVGTKITYDAFSYLRKLILTIKGVRKEFKILTGMSQLLLPNLIMGGDGGIVGLGNAFPKVHVDLYESFLEGNINEATRIYERILKISKIYDIGLSNSSATKATLEIMGAPIKPYVRRPLMEEGLETKEKIKKIIASVGYPALKGETSGGA